MEKLISTNTTGRYYQEGVISIDTKAIWFVFHGYGMLAKDFIKNFDCIADSSTVIIAPEGFHRFYNRSTRGEISANWMTSDLREKDIENNVNFLNGVLEDMYKSELPKNIQIGVLGFSQGSPTAFRWASQLKEKIRIIISWGSDIPVDVYSDNKLLNKINSSNIKLVIGTKDEYISEEKIDETILELHDQGVNFDFHTFSGGHELHPDTIRYFHARLMDDNLEY